MIQKRLKQLRNLMEQDNIDYYLVPSADAHRNEYVPKHWQRRAWISGFTGSAGDALIGKTSAYLWTDGRYFLQAEQQLDPNAFQLMKQQQQGSPPIHVWLQNHKHPIHVGVDPKTLTINQTLQFQTAFEQTKNKLVSIEENWIDLLWDDQPPLTISPIFHLDLKYTGRSTKDKINAVRSALKSNDAESIVISRLDEIAWLLNIRGNDIEYNPLVISYVILTQENTTFFINPEQISEEINNYFKSNNVDLKTYDSFQKALQILKDPVLLDPAGTSWWILQQLQHCEKVIAPSPIVLMKAIKNSTEQNGMREAHRIDAIAMIRFLHWLEKHWRDGMSEMDAEKQLETFRRDHPRCKGLSFKTISGFASNGAIIHYNATEKTNKVIDDSALYLLDSGGQYFEGTTDITRTLHLGQPTHEEKQHYTLVLKGHLALRHKIFPEGTCGEDLDPIARGPIQKAGYDYAHGTGHGVGCYLCVHEGPQTISPRPTQVPLEAGMIVSNEPGLYFEGRYGIRIENVCVILSANQPDTYQLDDLTLVPYARNLIDTTLLSKEEINWINTYHQKIFEQIASDLAEPEKKWLEKATKPLK